MLSYLLKSGNSCGDPLLPGQLNLFLKETLSRNSFEIHFYFFSALPEQIYYWMVQGLGPGAGRKGKVVLYLILNPNIYTQAPVHIDNFAPTF